MINLCSQTCYHCMGEIELGVCSQTCYHCTGEIERGELVVLAERMREDVCWHPACFICATCDELLVDLVYCHTGGSIYCERHYAQLIKPRCVACDEVSRCVPASTTPVPSSGTSNFWAGIVVRECLVVSGPVVQGQQLLGRDSGL